VPESSRKIWIGCSAPSSRQSRTAWASAYRSVSQLSSSTAATYGGLRIPGWAARFSLHCARVGRRHRSPLGSRPKAARACGIRARGGASYANCRMSALVQTQKSGLATGRSALHLNNGQCATSRHRPISSQAQAGDGCRSPPATRRSRWAWSISPLRLSRAPCVWFRNRRRR
jgi:hypothetical protein